MKGPGAQFRWLTGQKKRPMDTKFYVRGKALHGMGSCTHMIPSTLQIHVARVLYVDGLLLLLDCSYSLGTRLTENYENLTSSDISWSENGLHPFSAVLQGGQVIATEEGFQEDKVGDLDVNSAHFRLPQ